MNLSSERKSGSHRISDAGFAYVEVLVAIVVLAVLLVPALNALTSGILGLSIEPAAKHLALTNKMESVLSKPFSELYLNTGGNCSSASTAASAFSDPPGAPDRLIVVVYRYNYTTNACTPSDTGLLMVKVYLESDGGGSASSIHTLTSKWW